MYQPHRIQICFVLWASSLRNKIYLIFKLRMDRGFITIWEKWIERLRFDSKATDAGEFVVLKEECDCQSTKAQTKKSRTPRLLAYVKWTFHSNNNEVEMYSFNWYYAKSLFNILTIDLPLFSGTKYANVYSLCSCTTNYTVGRQKWSLVFGYC